MCLYFIQPSSFFVVCVFSLYSVAVLYKHSLPVLVVADVFYIFGGNSCIASLYAYYLPTFIISIAHYFRVWVHNLLHSSQIIAYIAHKCCCLFFVHKGVHVCYTAFFFYRLSQFAVLVFYFSGFIGYAHYLSCTVIRFSGFSVLIHGVSTVRIVYFFYAPELVIFVAYPYSFCAQYAVAFPCKLSFTVIHIFFCAGIAAAQSCLSSQHIITYCYWISLICRVCCKHLP